MGREGEGEEGDIAGGVVEDLEEEFGGQGGEGGVRGCEEGEEGEVCGVGCPG